MTYDQAFERAASAGAPGLETLRKAGVAAFRESGLPTTREEDWKYTSVRAIAEDCFAPPVDRVLDPEALEAARAGSLASDGAAELVFVNGVFAPDASKAEGLPEGVRIESLAAALRDSGNGVIPAIERGGVPLRGFAALNAGLASDGAFVRVPKGVRVEQPIHLVFAQSGGAGSTGAHPRVVIDAQEGSEATVVETFLSAGETASLSNVVTEILCGPGAGIEHIKVEREGEAAFHVQNVDVELARDARYTSRIVSLGAKLARTDVNVRLVDVGAECTLDGLYVGRHQQHVDHHTTIDHRAPHGTSRQLYKGVLAGRATGVFNGKVLVRQDAQQCDANQMNKNLLLSDDALINTKPELQILADDIRCAHGATVGRLDEEALFYLRSRGLDAGDARSLLIRAFVVELLERIEFEPLRAELERQLADRMAMPRVEVAA